jgi:hypothetical protein
MRAEGVDVPALELQLFSYSSVASQRFAFINGSRYQEGQQLPGGPLVVAISAEGVVLRHHGRDFVLSPQ